MHIQSQLIVKKAMSALTVPHTSKIFEGTKKIRVWFVVLAAYEQINKIKKYSSSNATNLIVGHFQHIWSSL